MFSHLLIECAHSSVKVMVGHMEFQENDVSLQGKVTESKIIEQWQQ